MKRIILTAVIFFAVTTSFQKNFAQDEQKIREGIIKVYEGIFTTGDFSEVDKYIDANITDHTPEQGQGPGLEGVKGAFKVFRNAFPDLKFRVLDIVFSGNKAAVFCNITGTNKGELMGMPPTNTKVDYNQIDLLYFNNENKATERWGYYDMNSLMKQLGMMK